MTAHFQLANAEAHPASPFSRFRNALKRTAFGISGATDREPGAAELSPAPSEQEAEVSPAPKPWMADGHLDHFSEADKRAVRLLRQQMVRMRVLEPVTPEDEAAVKLASSTLENSIDQTRVASFLPVLQRDEIIDELRAKVAAQLECLDRRVAEKMAASSLRGSSVSTGP